MSTIIQGAFANPTVTTHHGGHIAISGCIYDSHKNKITLSERFSGFFGDFYQTVNNHSIDIESDVQFLSGRSIYLGHIMTHYGHFILETLSTFHPLIEDNAYDYFVFHAFDRQIDTHQLPQFIVEAFQSFGISLEKIIIVDRLLQFESLLVSKRLVKLNHSIQADMLDVYKHLSESLFIQNHNRENKRQLKLYLSRVKNSHKSINRAILNEIVIEELLKQRGFTIVYLESLSIRKQLEILNQAELIVGFSGSALHNCVFLRRSTQLIEFGDVRAGDKTHPMQKKCNELSQVNAKFVPFEGRVLYANKGIGLVNYKGLMNTVDTLLDKSKDESSFVPFILHLKVGFIRGLVWCRVYLGSIKRFKSKSL